MKNTSRNQILLEGIMRRVRREVIKALNENDNTGYEIGGIKFSRLLPAAHVFEVVNELFFESKETFDTGDFKYKLCLSIQEPVIYSRGENTFFYNLSIVPSPDSLTPTAKRQVAESGEDWFVDYMDIDMYGYSVPVLCVTSDDWSDEIVDKIASVVGLVSSMVGFYLDKPVNRAGTDGWSILKKCIDFE